MLDALADLTEDTLDRFQGQLGGLTHPQPGLAETVKAAVLAKVVQVGTDYARARFMGHAGPEHADIAAAARVAEADDATNYVEDTAYSYARRY